MTTDLKNDNTCSENRYVPLLIALSVLLVGYPYLPDNEFGAFLGGFISLGLLISSVYVVRTSKGIFTGALVLALAAASTSAVALARGYRGDPLVEGAFPLFYAYMTIAIFLEVIKSRRVNADTILGIVCVYLLIGVTFGTLYDLIETLQPGSFHLNAVTGGGERIGWRTLIFFSFMTLTTVGYGDIIPATSQAQSLAIIEGVIGVLYVAVLIARIVGIYSQTDRVVDD